MPASTVARSSDRSRRWRAALLLVATLLLPFRAARASDGLDASQYLPLGAFNAWEMIDKALWDGGSGPKAEPQVVSVTRAFEQDGVVRYNVRTKFFQNVQDMLFQFGVEAGVVYLYGVRVIDPGPDLGNKDFSVPTVFFDQPVPVGNDSTRFGTFAVTPVTSKIDVSLKVGPKKVSAKVFIDGVVTAKWNAADPVLTPLGLLGTDPPLAELQLDFLFTYSSPNGDVDDELEGKVTNKSLRAVVGPGLGFVQIDGKGSQQKILNRAILPGELVSNPGEPDAFPALPVGDLAGFIVDPGALMSLDGMLGPEEGGIVDGPLAFEPVSLRHELTGRLVLDSLVFFDGAGPVAVVLQGKGVADAVTGGLKLSLAGQTKQFKALARDGFPKVLKFKVKQVLSPADDAPALLVFWTAGKHPVTKELVGGSFSVPVDPLRVEGLSVLHVQPVDVPVVKAGLLAVNPAKRTLGAEGGLVLFGTNSDGNLARVFPVTLIEKLAVKPGLPVPRGYVLRQTGLAAPLVRYRTASTEDAITLFKFGGKLIGAKLAAPLGDVELVTDA